MNHILWQVNSPLAGPKYPRLYAILSIITLFTLARLCMAPLPNRVAEIHILTYSYPKIPFHFFIIKPTKCSNFPNLFRRETLHVSDSSSAHHRSLFAVHSALVYVIQIWRQLSSRTRIELQFHPGPARKLSSYLYDIYQCRVYSE